MHKNFINRYMKHFKKLNIIFLTNRKDLEMEAYKYDNNFIKI